MFHGDGLFTRKDEAPRKDSRTLHPGSQPPAPQRALQPEPSKVELSSVPPRASESKGIKLIVGPDIKLNGAEITDCDTLVVEGRVEASMDSRVIQIAQQGVFCGTAGIDVAEIHGRFEGELTARKQLLIHATGKVTGKIRYGKLTIAEGGELSGDIGALNATDATRKDKPLLAKPLTGLV